MASPAQDAFFFEAGLCPPAFNMAADESLLELAATHRRLILRLYGWTDPAATFGYFQRFSEVSQATPLRPLIRRPTGGGIVPHDRDWTYCLAVPAGHSWHELRAVDSYRKIHEWVRDSFCALGVTCELAIEARKVLPGQCFAGWEQFDVVWKGRKLAGAAQRRTREGLLIQGSVQPPPMNSDRPRWHAEMLRAGEIRENIRWIELAWTPDLQQQALALAESKYARHDYNQKR
jgi:lipoate-protein ligase A